MAAEKDKKGRRKEEDSGYATGYETDSVGGSKPRTKLRKKKKQPSGDAGYETDDGYMSSSTNKSKSKSRFFRLGNRSKSTVDDDRPAEDIPAVPVPPTVFRLPIAERFATTLGNFNAYATVEPPLYASPTAAPSSPETPSIPTPKSLEQDSLPLRRQSSLLTSINNSLSKRGNTAVHFRDSDSSGERSGAISPTLSGASTILSKLSMGTSSPPRPKPIISYPLSRDPESAPPSPPSSYIRNAAASPVPSNGSTVMTRSPSKRVPGPLFIHRIPSDQKVPSLLDAKSRDDTIAPATPSPIISPFVVLTPNPGTPSSDQDNNLLSAPTSQKLSASGDFTSLSRTPSNENVIVVPSTDYVVPSPGYESRYEFHPPNTTVFNHHGHEIPPPSPPPTSPLPEVPTPDARGGPTSEDSHESSSRGHGDGYFSAQQRRSNLNVSPIPSIGGSSRSPTPRRGVESPFPKRPVMAPTTSANGTGFGSGGFENRVKVPRYRELYALQIPGNETPYGGSASSSRAPSPSGQRYGGASGHENVFSARESRRPELRQGQGQGRSKKHNRQSTQIGISVENPSDDEDEEFEGSYASGSREQEQEPYDSDEEIQNVLSRFRKDLSEASDRSPGSGAGRSMSDMGHGSGYRNRFDEDSEDGYEYEDDDRYYRETALGRRRSFEALQARAQAQPYPQTPTKTPPLQIITRSPSPSRPLSPPSRALSPFQLNSTSTIPIQKRVPLQPQKSIAGEALRERTRARMEAASPIPATPSKPKDEQGQDRWLSPNTSPTAEVGGRGRPELKELGGRGKASRVGFLGGAYRAYEVPGLPRSPSRSPYKEEFDRVDDDEDNGDDSDDKSYYPEDDKSMGRSTMYRMDNSSRYTTYTTYSDGGYSRTSRGSFLDAEKSEEARERFLRRIGEMYDENGREIDRKVVPPVPKLPEGLKMRTGTGTGLRVLDKVRKIEGANGRQAPQGSSTWI